MHHPASKNNGFSPCGGDNFMHCFVCERWLTGRGAVMWFLCPPGHGGHTPWWYLKTTAGCLIDVGRLECDVMTPLRHQSLPLFGFISSGFLFPSMPRSVSMRQEWERRLGHKVCQDDRLDGGGERGGGCGDTGKFASLQLCNFEVI